MSKITLDDETTAALTLFNEYVAADRERAQREKRLKKAERAKDDAAALVKKLSKRGSSTQRSEAEAAYRAAVEKWKAIRDGKELPADSTDTEAEEPAGTETSADTETSAGADTDNRAKAEAETEPEAGTETQSDPESKPSAENN